MLQLFEGAILNLIKNEISGLSEDAKQFALKELGIFCKTLFKYIEENLKDDEHE